MLPVQNTIPMHSLSTQFHTFTAEILINPDYTGPIIHTVIHRRYHNPDHTPVPSFTCPMHTHPAFVRRTCSLA